MASKDESSPETDDAGRPSTDKKIPTVVCGVRSPGPKYILKPVVGFNDHCLSKERGPAFSIYHRYPMLDKCKSPGPSYVYELPPKVGYTFGLRPKYAAISCTPGPKYVLPTEKGPAFKIGIRTKPRGGCATPAGYDVRLPIPGPAFVMGIRLPTKKCETTPAGRPYSEKLTALNHPAYSFRRKLRIRDVCQSPGPKYHPALPKPNPMYTFGMKHSLCAPPYITDCDDDC